MRKGRKRYEHLITAFRNMVLHWYKIYFILYLFKNLITKIRSTVEFRALYYVPKKFNNPYE